MGTGETRDEQTITIIDAILNLADDRRAIAQRHLKAQLKLTFEDPARVYSLFDFSKTRLPKNKKSSVGL